MPVYIQAPNYYFIDSKRENQFIENFSDLYTFVHYFCNGDNNDDVNGENLHKKNIPVRKLVLMESKVNSSKHIIWPTIMAYRAYMTCQQWLFQ